MPTSNASAPEQQAARRKYRIPWSLIVALVVYYAGVAAYVQAQYWSSPEYQAAEHVVEAERLLGREDGRFSKRDELTSAYEHLLEAARQVPSELWIHKKLETLNARFEQHGWEVPLELRRRADAVAILWQRRDDANRPMMAVGLRDRGWDPESLLNGPGKAFAWSLVGAAGIVFAWAQLTFSRKRAREKEREEELKKLEQEVEELGAWRTGLPVSPAPAPPRKKSPSREGAGSSGRTRRGPAKGPGPREE